MKNYYAAKKLLSLAGIMCVLACLTLGACGSESPTTGAAVAAGPTATVSATGAATSTAKSTTVAVTNTVMPTAKITPTVEPTVRNSVQINWLKGVPCRSLCWENITPGKITPGEALELLKKNPEIHNPQFAEPKSSSKSEAITWDTMQNFSYRPWGFMTFNSQQTPSLIELIKPEIQPYKLKDVFSLYEEPSHIIAEYAFQEGTQPQQYDVSLIYMAQGLVLFNKFNEIPVFTPATEFTVTYFFTPGLPGFDIINTKERLNGAAKVEWQGFKDFKFYCRRGDGKINEIKNCI